MNDDEFKRRSEVIWSKATEHLKRLFEFVGRDTDGVLRPLDFPGFGAAVYGLIGSLADLYDEMRELEEKSNRMPQIRLKSFRAFLKVLGSRLR